MNLTKGKLSKLYNKQRQSHKKYKNKKTDIKTKTFRKKVNNNLAIKTLKNIKYYKIKGGSDKDEKVMESVNTLIDYLTNKIADKMNYPNSKNIDIQNGFDSVNEMANVMGQTDVNDQPNQNENISVAPIPSAIDEPAISVSSSKVENIDVAQPVIETSLVEQLPEPKSKPMVETSLVEQLPEPNPNPMVETSLVEQLPEPNPMVETSVTEIDKPIQNAGKKHNKTRKRKNKGNKNTK